MRQGQGDESEHKMNATAKNSPFYTKIYLFNKVFLCATIKVLPSKNN